MFNLCVCCTSDNQISRMISSLLRSCSTPKNKSCVNGANLWLNLKISAWTEGWEAEGWKVFRITHRVGVCCEGWLMRSSCCWRVVAPRDDQSEVIGVSALWEFSREAADHLPPPLLTGSAPKWLMLTATLLLPFLASFPSADSEPLGWGENKFAALWSRPADQWQGGGRSWGRPRKGLRRGILCNGVENTKERQAHAFVIFVFLRSLPPPLFLSCSLSPFCVADLNPLSSVSPSGSSGANKCYINRR